MCWITKVGEGKRERKEDNKEMMSTTSQTSVNHSLFEEQDQISTQMGFNIPFPSNQAFPPLGCHQSLKSISAVVVPSLSSEPASSAANFAETLFSTAAQRPREDLTSSLVGGGGGQLLSLNRSRLNPW